MPKVRGIMALEIFWCIWSALFVASLFFVGKHLQNFEEKFSEDAVIIKNDPYLAMQDVLDALRTTENSDELKG